jgi:hypothetical protein
VKLDQSQSPANCPECKRLGKKCAPCWAKHYHELADSNGLKVVSITPKPEKVVSKELFGGEQP